MSEAPARIGLDNLASFVAATMGRIGHCQLVPGGVAVSSTVPVANGYVNAAFRTDESIAPSDFLSGAGTFFAALGHPFVVWAPLSDTGFVDHLVATGGSALDQDTPMMSVAAPLTALTGLDVRPASSPHDRQVFGRLCETGYDKAGLAWLLDQHQSYDAPGSVWAIAADGTDDLGVGCGYLDGATGGIFYVATPPEQRGRGAAASVTTWLVNHLIACGATEVVLQASDAGLPIYERLGFATVETYRRFTVDPSG